jgi:hypothetical protein
MLAFLHASVCVCVIQSNLDVYCQQKMVFKHSVAACLYVGNRGHRPGGSRTSKAKKVCIALGKKDCVVALLTVLAC